MTRIQHCFRIVLLVLAGLTLLPAQAARFYDVELILFENLNKVEVNDEVWPEETTAGEPSAIDLFANRDGIPLSNPLTSGGFEVLGVNEKQLSGSHARLRNSRDYRPVLHLAWRQPGLGQSKAIPIRIAGGRKFINPARFAEESEPVEPLSTAGSAVVQSQGFVDQTQTGTTQAPGAAQSLLSASPPGELDELEGTIRVVLGRYLHVHTDLLFRRMMPVRFGIQPEASTEESSTPDTSAARSTAGLLAPAGQNTQLMGFRMQQHRRMRSNELHYIDHPAFGMMIIIRRAPVTNG